MRFFYGRDDFQAGDITPYQNIIVAALSSLLKKSPEIKFKFRVDMLLN